MIHKLIVRAEARADIVEAHRWYEDRIEGLGLEFARATDTCFDLISRNPNIYPKLYKEVSSAGASSVSSSAAASTNDALVTLSPSSVLISLTP